MAAESDRIVVRLGSLQKHLEKYAKQNGLAKSVAARRLIAQGLGQKEPTFSRGTAALGKRDRTKQARAAVRARWAKRKKEE